MTKIHLLVCQFLALLGDSARSDLYLTDVSASAIALVQLKAEPLIATSLVTASTRSRTITLEGGVTVFNVEASSSHKRKASALLSQSVSPETGFSAYTTYTGNYTEYGVEWSTSAFRLVTATLGGTWSVGDLLSKQWETAFFTECRTQPAAADFDLVHGYLYWSCPSEDDGAIYRSGWGGSGDIEVVSTQVVPDVRPGGLCVDPKQEYIYYGLLNQTGVYRADLDGNNQVLLIPDHSMAACEVVKGVVYFVNGQDARVMIMNPDGYPVDQLFNHSNDTSVAFAPNDALDSLTSDGNWSEGAFVDLVAVGDVLYVADGQQNQIVKINFKSGETEDSLPVAERKAYVNFTAPTSIEYSETTNALIISSKHGQVIYSVSAVTPEITQLLYSGEQYGVMALCGSPCPILPRTYG